MEGRGFLMEEVFRLPERILLEDFSGNIASYLEAVYCIFRNDFVLNRPSFRGIRLGLKKYPLVQDKEYTFYHMTHEGSDESRRTPDIKRMERMPFPAPMINHSTHPYLKVWRNTRNRNKQRILIFHEAESYLVVLDDRGDYILPWTAYFVEHGYRKRRLLQEYEEYIRNADAAQ